MIITLSPSEARIAEIACDSCRENWLESHEDYEGIQEVPTPTEWPEVKNNVLTLPENRDVIEDFLVRMQDNVDIPEDNIVYLKTLFFKDVKEQTRNTEEIAAYKNDLRAAKWALKRINTAIASQESV
jgi:hypothetical protein